ncbi:phage minor capsid protein [Desulfocurvibacter africanus]|uniref:phage minor capsid protein n=1 Tax=Desulfocurvibacter africanus TaxID=873 RepID=UPI00041A4796|nr:phage minor capsid protein [Desulfocurvibacter africanus]
MSNALTKFKQEYAKGVPIENPDRSADIAQEAERRIQQAYEDAYNKIFKLLAVERRELSYSAYSKQSALLKQIAGELDRLKNTAGRELKRAMLALADYVTAQGLEDLTLAGAAPKHPENFFQELNREYVRTAFQDTYRHIAGQTERMTQEAKELLQRDAAMISRRAAVEGLSRKAAYKLLKDQIQKRDPSFTFVDKKGRAWSMKDYLGMLTRTTMAETQREAYTNTLTAAGHDLVKISSHGAKDACRGWEGKVLSLTGATPGYPTLEEAKASRDIFHPRCRHRFTAYHPEA